MATSKRRRPGQMAGQGFADDVGSSSTSTLSRRGLLASALAIGATVLAPVGAMAETCRRFLAGDAGPFFPAEPIQETHDLLSLEPDPRRLGTVLYLVGRLIDAECRPVAGAEVLIWQCDSGGQYRHVRAPRVKDLEPGFLYFAKCVTADDGAYWFRTLRPAPYQIFGLKRAPHIHLRARAPGRSTVTTEVYFAGAEGDELRREDRVFLGRGTRRGELVAAVLPAGERRELLRREPEPGAQVCEHDVVLGDAREAAS